MGSKQRHRPPQAGETSEARDDSLQREWERIRSADRSPGRRKEFTTSSGLPVEPLYLPPAVREPSSARARYREQLGFPGSYPFTRGIYPAMYRGRVWTMRQYAGYATAEETNQRYRYLLERGQTGLSVAFDLPTQMGLDSDSALAAGEVGKAGVAIDSIHDLEVLFDRIAQEKVTTSMTINATAATLLAFYAALAEKRGLPLASLGGTVQNDILKEYVARGTYIYPPQPSLRLVVDVMEFCSRQLPRWNSISVSGYHMREAGATAVQEVAFTLCNAIAYLEAAVTRGLEVNRIGRRVSFFFNAHNCFFEEVAKFRAARRLWARLMVERFGATDPRAQRLRFHTQTAGSTLTAQQPNNNIVRVTMQALAAVLGGTQSLHTNARDEALWLPTEESARLALRTQQLLAFESGIADTVDPLAGSYYVEDLTDRVEEEAGELIRKVDEMGGALRAVENRFFARELEASAYHHQVQVDSGAQVVVGVNRFREEEPAAEVRPFPFDPALAARQVARLRERKRVRSASAVQAALAALGRMAEGEENLVPGILACVRAEATLGEISSTLRSVFGSYQEH